MSVYDQLYAIASHHLQAYRDDLEKHDRQALEDYPGVPFLHWTRSSGTHITFLRPADDYPAPGVRVPYLFGTADRDHLLNEVVSIARYFADPINPQASLVLHYGGKRLQKVSATEALEIARLYREKVKREWRQARAATA
jgi:hypothetical protein